MSDYFPVEVIVEILQRLPMKSLVRCMCVCRTWKSIITDDSFIISHHHHLKFNPANSSLFFHLEFDGNAMSDWRKGYFYSLCTDDDATDNHSFFKFPPVCYPSSHAFDTWAVYGTCNGLVCFADYSSSNLGKAVIWNPSIHKYLILPKSSLTLKTRRYFYYDSRRYYYYGFGFDSQNRDFKVVRMVSPGYCETISHVEIYSLAAHCWRTIVVEALPFEISTIKNKFINGVLHWLAYRKINRRHHYFILTFDIVEEKFGELMLPKCLKEPQYTMSQNENVESHDGTDALY